jgi:hypothetical protein
MTSVFRSDRVTRVAPLGVRFWDPVEQMPVTEGLLVRVRAAGSRVGRPAVANESAIFTVCDLPGLAVAEHGQGDDPYWAVVVTRSFVVEVEDASGQFMPFSFPAQLPVRGLFVWTCAQASPPQAMGCADGVLLFSAPSRSVSPMRAVIRAQIQEALTGRPAAGAVLSALVGNTPTAVGMADDRGRVAIVLPYPEPIDFPPIAGGMSPPNAPVGGPLSAYTWPASLMVQYARVTPYPRYPDLCTVLSQPAAQLWADTLGTPLGPQTLTMGVDLVVRSIDATSGEPLPVLLVA